MGTGDGSQRGSWLPSSLDGHTPSYPPQSPAPSAVTFLFPPCGYVACPCVHSPRSPIQVQSVVNIFFPMDYTFLVRAVCTSSSFLVFNHRMTCDPQQSHSQLQLPDPGSVLGFPSYPNRQQRWVTTPSCNSSFPASPGHLTSGSLFSTCLFFFLRLVCKWY